MTKKLQELIEEKLNKRLPHVGWIPEHKVAMVEFITEIAQLAEEEGRRRAINEFNNRGFTSIMAIDVGTQVYLEEDGKYITPNNEVEIGRCEKCNLPMTQHRHVQLLSNQKEDDKSELQNL